MKKQINKGDFAVNFGTLIIAMSPLAMILLIIYKGCH